MFKTFSGDNKGLVANKIGAIEVYTLQHINR